MKKLRYSDVVGAYYYNIGLSDDDKDLVDTHFTGAAHHLKRFHEADSALDKRFHLSRHRMHMRSMMEIIYERGDFSKASDGSNRGLENRETWNPDWTTMPDELMFEKMLPDWRYPVGSEHCSDHYLHRSDKVQEIIDNKRLAN
jgi:hypothetical protein